MNNVRACEKGGQQTTAEKTLDHLATRGPIVTLADGNFTRYADGKSAATKPYHLVVLFTALAPKYKCISCRCVRTSAAALFFLHPFFLSAGCRLVVGNEEEVLHFLSFRMMRTYACMYV